MRFRARCCSQVSYGRSKRASTVGAENREENRVVARGFKTKRAKARCRHTSEVSSQRFLGHCWPYSGIVMNPTDKRS